jgi:4-hydroxy-tetrahydrodipicolinate synthase
LKPLFDIVTVKTVEETAHGQVEFKARNPLPIKTLMGVLGLPSGPLRPPMGKMTKQGITLLIGKAQQIQNEHPEVFTPLGEFFDVDVNERLSNEKYRSGWYYDAY